MGIRRKQTGLFGQRCVSIGGIFAALADRDRRQRSRRRTAGGSQVWLLDGSRGEGQGCTEQDRYVRVIASKYIK